jgi:hypothetical protein
MKDLNEEIRRIKQLSGMKLNEDSGISDWDSLYQWLKIFSTDGGKYLRDNNIQSGIWLKRAIDNGEVTIDDLNLVAKNGDGQIFSDLSVAQRLINK